MSALRPHATCRCAGAGCVGVGGALRPHATCPECARTEPLRPDGTMLRHMRGFVYSRTGRAVCIGGGKPPVPGSAEAWLAAQAESARKVIASADPRREEARARLADELAQIDRAEAEARDTLSEVRPALYLEGRRRGADLCGEMIAALPLPGEEVPRDR